MSDCNRYHEKIENALAGELTAGQLEELRRHAAKCPECSALLRLHAELLQTGDALPEADPDALRAMREAVSERIARKNTPRAAKQSFLMDLRNLWRGHPAAATVALAATLAAAVLLGAWTPFGAGVGLPPETDPAVLVGGNPPAEQNTDYMLAELSQVGSSRSGLEDYWDTPYALDNVSVRPRSDGQLSLSFDVCRHVDVETDRNSALAHEVLLHAVLEPSSLGSRFDAMAVMPEIVDDQLQEALILTLQNDPSLAVRINALSTLGRYPYNDRIQDALVQTLRNDPEVQMRLLALDDLTGRHVDMNQLRSTVNEPEFDQTLALLQQMTEVSYE